jgi:hypothetical protein
MMRRSPLGTACLLAGPAVLLAAALADATPVALYNWDQCEPFVRNRDYEGPAVYSQTVSITGLPQGTERLTFYVDVLAGDNDLVWGFYPNGCPGPERLTMIPGVAGCDSIPGLTIEVGEMTQPADYVANTLEVTCVLDPSFLPDPERRYGVVTIRFDHRATETMCQGPMVAPLCFHYVLGFFEAAGNLGVVVAEHDRITWNDHSAEPDCSPRRTPLPVQRTTWGALKVHYR